MLKINIMNSGNHNNLYCSAKKDGIKLKLVMFLDTETAYIMSMKRKNLDIKVDWDVLYREITEAVNDKDFELITPRKGFMRLKMNSEQFKYHLKDKYGL